MHFIIAPANSAYNGVTISSDIELIPSKPLDKSNIKDVAGIADALAKALTKAAPVVAMRTQPGGALIPHYLESDSLNKADYMLLSPSTKDTGDFEVGSNMKPSQLGPYGDFVLGVLDEVMKDQIGAHRPAVLVRHGCPNLLSEASLLRTININSAEHNFEVKNLTSAGELLLGLGQEDFTKRISSNRIIELLERCQLTDQGSSEARMQQLISLVQRSTTPHLTIDAFDKIILARQQLDSTLNSADTAVMNVFWGSKNIGQYIQSRQQYSIVLDSEPLQQALVKRGAARENSAIPALVNNNMPELSMDGSSKNGYISRVLKHGFYALGNLAVLHEDKRALPIDVKGAPMRDFIDADRVFPGAVFNVVRPSQLGQKGDFDILHDQLNPSKNELTISGAQVKTVGFLGRGEHGSYVQKATLDKNATCLVKIPSATIGGRAAFGAIEWLSMTLAKSSGLDVPEFALIDFNKATRRYLRDSGPATLEERAGELNLAALDMKRQIFAQGASLGQDRIKQVRLTNSHEKTTGDVQEPPGYMIERFDLPNAASEGIIGVDFATLMGLDASDKFKRCYEDAANVLRANSTSFHEDAPKLMRRIMGSWLLVDSDLHMKNLSVLIKADLDSLQQATVRLSPAYDILSAAGINGLKHEMATSLNGTEAPHLNDFIDFGVQHLDMTAEQVTTMANDMAQGILAKSDELRACPLEKRYQAPRWPEVIQNDANLRHTMDLTLDSICANLALKGLLPAHTCESVLLNIQSENPSAYASMVAMNVDAGYSLRPSSYDDLHDEIDRYGLDDDANHDGAPFSI